MRSHLSLAQRSASVGIIALLALAGLSGPAAATDLASPSAPPDGSAPTASETPTTTDTPTTSEIQPAPTAELEKLRGTWRRMARAPFSAVDMAGGWTGSELIVVDPEQERRAAAYDPNTDKWRAIARPPWKVDPGSAAHWTGTELFFVEARGSAKRGLAAYDPATDKWRRTASPPTNDIAGSAWVDGVLVTVSGPDLASATYDPELDTWTGLPPVPVPTGPDGSILGEPLSLHLVDEQVFALVSAPGGTDPSDGTDAPDGEPGARLALVPLDLADRKWGEPSIGPLSASSSRPLGTGATLTFLTATGEGDGSLGTPARDGSYDPLTDTWSTAENHCGLDTSDDVWTGAHIIGMSQRRALDPASGECLTLTPPPWSQRDGALQVWTGSEVLEFSGAAKEGAPPRRDGLAFGPFPEGGALGVVLDKPSHPVRIRIPSLGIDLPVISNDRPIEGSSPGYPACDVALYWPYFDLPGEPGATWILAHSQEGMFLPLLEKARRSGARSLLDRRIELQLRDGRLLTYRTFEVRPRSNSSDLSIAREDRRGGEQRLVLQTSTGAGSAPKLEVAARLVDVATTDEPRPRPKPRACG